MKKVKIAVTIGVTLKDSHVFINGEEIPIMSLTLNMGVDRISTINIETPVGQLDFAGEVSVKTTDNATKIIKKLLKKYKKKEKK